MSWKCPYCNQVATIQDQNVSSSVHVFEHGNKLGQLALTTHVIVCPNAKCKEFTLEATLRQLASNGYGHATVVDPILRSMLKPQSSAKPVPDYVPHAIRSDYEEACLIASLSPKASATLSRRCLQGMIRDFYKIVEDTLFKEIQKLKTEVDAVTWNAIDSVRCIGNIGAHMEKDISVIVDVDPDEALLLIGLIEVLLEEWYVHRHNREQSMKKITDVAASKKDQQKQFLPISTVAGLPESKEIKRPNSGVLKSSSSTVY